MAVECYGDEFEMYLTDILRDEGSLKRRRLFEQFMRGASSRATAAARSSR